MGKSVGFATSFLNHLLNNADIANIGNAGGLLQSSADGSLYISLHTADPSAGNQSTNAAAYTGYARQAVTRDGTGWTVASGGASNAAPVLFPIATLGTETITHWGLGTASSGSGVLLFSDAVTTPLAVSVGIIPEFDTGDLTLAEA